VCCSARYLASTPRRAGAARHTQIQHIHTYLYCSVLQCVAVCCMCCSVLQCVLPHKHTTMSWHSKTHTQNICTYLYGSVMQCVACAAVCCSMLQCVLPYKHTMASWGSKTYIKQSHVSILQCGAACHSVWQCVAVYCSVLQCFAVRVTLQAHHGELEQQDTLTEHSYLSILQCVALCCTVSQGVVVCCRLLQCVAVCCSACYLTRTPRRAGAARRTQSSI